MQAQVAGRGHGQEEHLPLEEGAWPLLLLGSRARAAAVVRDGGHRRESPSRERREKGERTEAHDLDREEGTDVANW